ncbi:MAG: YybH family protein [Pyrinomonadaceae bacterium]
MLKRFFITATLCAVLALSCFAQATQTTPTQTTRTRTTTTTAPATTAPQQTPPRARTASPQVTPTPIRTPTTNTRVRTAEAPHRAATSQAVATNQDITGARGEMGVREVTIAFDALVQGIERADVNAVTSAYWNSPQLVLFNYNGTTTKTWEQLQKNRASSYPLMKDVRLDIRDRRVQMLAPNAALVTCLWKQSQTFRGTPETVSGRMTLVYRRVGNVWKIFHLHTSPDTLDPSRVPASEQTPAAAAPSNAAPRPTPVRSKPAP